MPIVPTLRCTEIRASVSFCTELLDFEVLHPTSGRELVDPTFVPLVRGGDLLFLSSHGGDGVPGQAVSVLVEDVEAPWNAFRSRGLNPPPGDSPVHQGPTEQTWGTREIYVDDPDGNTFRFMEGVDPQGLWNGRGRTR